MTTGELRLWCETAYEQYHHARFISPDPLELVVVYPELRDREIAGFIAASLATGRVAAIIRTVSWVLDRLESPHAALTTLSETDIRRIFSGFVYRFFDGRQLSGLLIALKRVLQEYRSLEACVDAGRQTANRAHRQSAGATEESVIAGIGHLARRLRALSDGTLDGSILVAQPDRRSACKRLFLFLRWMVRSDCIDPGGWTAVSPSELLVPVDTHMLSACRSLGLTAARQPSLAVAREITAGFRTIAAEDPVRYDFSLTRLGIHPEVRKEELSRKIAGIA